MAGQLLEGKVAIVTGAGSPIGIGHAITVALVRAGARVAMMDINREWLDESVNEVREIGGDDCAAPILADVTDAEAVEAAVKQTIAELGGLHILVNNAGTNPSAAGLVPEGQGNPTRFWDVSIAAWTRVITVNVSGPFLMARAVVGHMMEQGWGRIIGVTTSLDTMLRNVPYGPSKASHEAFVAAMARDLEGTGVTANVLVPGGGTNTNFNARNPGRPTEGMRLEPEIMQAPAVWLASEESDGVNGRRFDSRFWDESASLAERLEKASGPAGWPQLGRPEFQDQP